MPSERMRSSPSKTRAPPREALTALLTASPLPSSRRRDLRGAGLDRPRSEPFPSATPQPPPGPSGTWCRPPTCDEESRPACGPAPPWRASCRAACATSSAQRLSAEKRTARVSMMCAPSYSAVRTIASPTRLTAPVMSVSPDWYFLGVRPKCAPTALERANRSGASTRRGEGHGDQRPHARHRHQPPADLVSPHDRQHGPMQLAELRPERLARLQHRLGDPLQHRVTRHQRCARARRTAPC